MEMRESLLQLAIDFLDIQNMEDNAALEEQRSEKKRKEDELKEKAINKAKDDYIHKCSLFEQFHSLVCWKTPDQVDIELNKIKGARAKLDAVKQNIKIYVKNLE